MKIFTFCWVGSKTISCARSPNKKEGDIQSYLPSSIPELHIELLPLFKRMFHLFVFVVKDRRLVAIREFSLKENLEEASLAWKLENLRQLLPKKSKWKNVSYLKSWRQALPIAPSPMMTSFLVMTSCLSVSLSAISSAKTTLATLERANRNVLGRLRPGEGQDSVTAVDCSTGRRFGRLSTSSKCLYNQQLSPLYLLWFDILHIRVKDNILIMLCIQILFKLFLFFSLLFN